VEILLKFESDFCFRAGKKRIFEGEKSDFVFLAEVSDAAIALDITENMLIELGGWTASQSGMMLSSVTFARAAQVVLLLLATILVLYYRTLLLQWRSTVYSVTASTWLLTRPPAPAADPAPVQNLVTVDKRLSLDSAESRRLSRAEFLQEHKDFDYGMSIVSHPP
jgi:hypothetical protein